MTPVAGTRRRRAAPGLFARLHPLDFFKDDNLPQNTTQICGIFFLMTDVYDGLVKKRSIQCVLVQLKSNISELHKKAEFVAEKSGRLLQVAALFTLEIFEDIWRTC